MLVYITYAATFVQVCQLQQSNEYSQQCATLWKCEYLNCTFVEASNLVNTATVTTMCSFVLCHNTGACSYILPNAMSAASLYLQSELLILSLTKGRTNGTMSSSQHVASSMRQTPAALLGFQSSSSSYSSCNVGQTSTDTVQSRHDNKKSCMCILYLLPLHHSVLLIVPHAIWKAFSFTIILSYLKFIFKLQTIPLIWLAWD